MSSRIDNITESVVQANIFYYSCFSKSLDMFNIPFFASSDEDAIRLIVDKAAAAHDPSLTYGLLNCDIKLFKLAMFKYDPQFYNDLDLVATAEDLRDRLLNIRKDFKSYVDNLPKEVSDDI